MTNNSNTKKDNLKMNYYLCFIDVIGKIYLIKAKNKKEAFSKIWDNYIKYDNIESKKNGYAPIYRNEINIVNINSFDKELEENSFIEL